MDVVALSKLQFALTVMYHSSSCRCRSAWAWCSCSPSAGTTRAAMLRMAASDFWIKLFTATFAVGVATGIVMEFAFGTNWATYSRFVGDIFGAPLAAEALFAFFLESMFLAVLLFGRSRVSKRFFYVSAWLVWVGSMLSALWIIIANSWMQTPAGYRVVDGPQGPKAQLTDFFAAAFNPSTLPRYFHTIDAVLMAGGFVAIAIGRTSCAKARTSISGARP